MSRTPLLTPILDGGIEHPHFFNGRLLTGEDLKDQQAALRRQHAHLGRAVGAGVVHGLEVTALDDKRGVAVTAGLAVSRKGQTLCLPDDRSIAIVPETTEREPSDPLFNACEQLSITASPTGTGAYLLTIAPAAAYKGRALKVSLEDDGVARGCGSRYLVEGVQFRLVPLDHTSETLFAGTTGEQAGNLLNAYDEDERWKLRNLLAHLCFGSEELAAHPESPFTPIERYGLVDQLLAITESPLSDCDVPLAILLWTNNGIAFVDMWSVRRRLLTLAVTSDWPWHAGRRRVAEAEAMFLQFQDQLGEMEGESIDPLKAKNHFRFLPAGGYVPGRYPEFFKHSGVVTYPRLLDHAESRALIERSWYFEPIDLEAFPKPAVELRESPSSFFIFTREIGVARGFPIPQPGLEVRRPGPAPEHDEMYAYWEPASDDVFLQHDPRYWLYRYRPVYKHARRNKLGRRFVHPDHHSSRKTSWSVDDAPFAVQKLDFSPWKWFRNPAGENPDDIKGATSPLTVTGVGEMRMLAIKIRIVVRDPSDPTQKLYGPFSETAVLLPFQQRGVYSHYGVLLGTEASPQLLRVKD